MLLVLVMKFRPPPPPPVPVPPACCPPPPPMPPVGVPPATDTRAMIAPIDPWPLADAPDEPPPPPPPELPPKPLPPVFCPTFWDAPKINGFTPCRSEEHTSELQSLRHL